MTSSTEVLWVLGEPDLSRALGHHVIDMASAKPVDHTTMHAASRPGTLLDPGTWEQSDIGLSLAREQSFADPVWRQEGQRTPIPAIGARPASGGDGSVLDSPDQRRFGRPVVFGDPDRPLAGRLHRASGAVRGAVVLCNPWGYEENCSYTTFQLLAYRLVQDGFNVLRFDYESCGNSWGDGTDPEQFAYWIENCGQAITFLGSLSRHKVHVVGLRLGAALATLAASRFPVASCVLWDPVVNGRRYLRAIRATSMMGVNSGPDSTEPGSLLIIGNRLNAATVQNLERLDLLQASPPSMEAALVISRPQNPDAKRLATKLESSSITTQIEDHSGIDTLIDTAAEQAVIPDTIVERIVTWLGAREQTPLLPAAASIDHDPIQVADADWVEIPISIGPARLAGILTMPRHPHYAGTVLMSNNGVARAIGPARAWVDWARAWAKEGITSLRMDVGGFGDSAAHPGQRTDTQHPIETIDDLHAGVEELRRRNLGPVVVVGLCSGAFMGIDAAASKASLEGVVAINGQLFCLPDPPGAPERHKRAAPPTHPWVQWFLENTRGGRFLSRRLPYPFWQFLDLLRLQPSPLKGADAAALHSRILMIYGDDDLGLLRLKQRARKDLARWEHSGGLLVMDGVDHSMFAPQARDRVERHVHDFLLKTLPALADLLNQNVVTPPAGQGSGFVTSESTLSVVNGCQRILK